MWGATGLEPWPHTWCEYKRLFTGWRRHRWEFAGQLCVIAANGLLPRKDRRSWQLHDFTPLAKPPARWKSKLSAAADVIKSLFCRRAASPDADGTDAAVAGVPAEGDDEPP